MEAVDRTAVVYAAEGRVAVDAGAASVGARDGGVGRAWGRGPITAPPQWGVALGAYLAGLAPVSNEAGSRVGAVERSDPAARDFVAAVEAVRALEADEAVAREAVRQRGGQQTATSATLAWRAIRVELVAAYAAVAALTPDPERAPDLRGVRYLATGMGTQHHHRGGWTVTTVALARYVHGVRRVDSDVIGGYQVERGGQRAMLATWAEVERYIARAGAPRASVGSAGVVAAGEPAAGSATATATTAARVNVPAAA